MSTTNEQAASEDNAVSITPTDLSFKITPMDQDQDKSLTDHLQKPEQEDEKKPNGDVSTENSSLIPEDTFVSESPHSETLLADDANIGVKSLTSTPADSSCLNQSTDNNNLLLEEKPVSLQVKNVEISVLPIISINEPEPQVQEKEKSTEMEASAKEQESQSSTKLPKWMVEDANAPISPEQTKDVIDESTEQKKNVEEKKVGRGRGRRPKTEVQKAFEAESSQSKELLSQRPRRSTRSRVDYANPDAGTIIAEATDEELGRLSKIQGKGRKRKVSESENDYDIDSGSDYGKKSNKRKAIITSKKTPATPTTKGRRGRPPGSSNKGKKKHASIRAGRKSAKGKTQFSDSDDNDVVFDDSPSEKGCDSNEESSEAEPEIVPRRVSEKPHSVVPAKRRGRPPRKVQAHVGMEISNETSANKRSKEVNTPNYDQSVEAINNEG